MFSTAWLMTSVKLINRLLSSGWKEPSGLFIRTSMPMPGHLASRKMGTIIKFLSSRVAHSDSNSRLTLWSLPACATSRELFVMRASDSRPLLMGMLTSLCALSPVNAVLPVFLTNLFTSSSLVAILVQNSLLFFFCPLNRTTAFSHGTTDTALSAMRLTMTSIEGCTSKHFMTLVVTAMIFSTVRATAISCLSLLCSSVPACVAKTSISCSSLWLNCDTPLLTTSTAPIT
mmetsp:Transcript_20399/g.51510  ORF Transcript_20399/g.51510 Transcript_20399/m.51510 type:complete len:230 (+) Transcript_20399:175-864(+)